MVTTMIDMDLIGKKVLIVKLRYIGDTLSLLPVIDNLKEKAPDVTVDVMVNKGTEELLAHHTGIGKLWIYDRMLAKKHIILSLSYHRNLINKLRSEGYDIVIDFTHGDRAAFLSFMTGAPQRITYQNSSTLSHLLMNCVIRSNPFKHHIVDYQLESLSIFGLDHFDRAMKLHIPESIYTVADNLISDAEIAHNSLKVVIHPGARGKLRQWLPQRFAEIGCLLIKRYQATILLVGGPGEDELVEEVERHMGFSASFKSTHLGLLELAALLSRCQLFIGNDSAPGHIAASVNCPNITLFGPTFPHMWRPLSPLGEVVFKGVPCCGCRQETCIRPGNHCMDIIEVDEVWEKVEKLFSSPSTGEVKNLEEMRQQVDH
ncbi:MAG: glycosyltransferase family 9 protein [Deltaproteobacteria bacterium]|nr:glycosyltransferase family 9 protein [Deltaproteobacteria bacterium]